jgi:hypothetical protein
MRLIDLVFRPINTSKTIMRILRESEVNIEFTPKRPDTKIESGFVVLGHYHMMPASSFKLIEQSIVKVDSSGYGENTVWRRQKDQTLSLSKISFEQAVAMCVNEKLEAANGK